MLASVLQSKKKSNLCTGFNFITCSENGLNQFYWLRVIIYLNTYETMYMYVCKYIVYAFEPTMVLIITKHVKDNNVSNILLLFSYKIILYAFTYIHTNIFKQPASFVTTGCKYLLVLLVFLQFSSTAETLQQCGSSTMYTCIIK